MAKTKIEWTGKNGYTWNPIVGCSHASPGCLHCYAETMAKRLVNIDKTVYKYESVISPNGWTGNCFLDESELEKPFHWKKSRVIFVSSMGDLFHENVPFELIDKVMAVIALNPRHTFMILTKRAERMAEYFNSIEGGRLRADDIPPLQKNEVGLFCGKRWPLPNLHLGVTTENQETADLRIPILLQIPAALRFVSIEPMLGPVDLTFDVGTGEGHRDSLLHHGLDWVILGMETGHGARTFPGAAEAIINVKDQCQAAGVPFFYKGPMSIGHYKDISKFYFCYHGDGKEKEHTIDGVEYRQFPQGA